MKVHTGVITLYHTWGSQFDESEEPEVGDIWPEVVVYMAATLHFSLGDIGGKEPILFIIYAWPNNP